ncbi:MAG: pentapeptide repeat-containing protein [Symploca sp. SIO2B6]|nr:pentapeptide repeat-containing protein [Symploca sp. SIO2B6]
MQNSLKRSLNSSTGLLLLILLLIFLSTPVWAAAPAPERTVLTLELLQERINSPIQSEGIPTIDLQQMIVDLTSENAEFRDQFYQQLQTQLNRSQIPLGLDLSDSLIQGEFSASRLGLSTPLSPGNLSSLLSPMEQEQLESDQRFFPLPGEQIPSVTVLRGPLKIEHSRLGGIVNFANTFFLQGLEASEAIFIQPGNWSHTRFGRFANFSGAIFGQEINFSQSTFFNKVRFSQTQFRGLANFAGTTFYNTANFSQAEFEALANFNHTQWLQDADFRAVNWHERSLWSNNSFFKSLLITDATWEKSTTFRGSKFQQPVLLNNVSLFDQIDFSNTSFAPQSYLNVAGLSFGSEQAKIVGDTGEIGRLLYVPTLTGNEDVLHNLVFNFRGQQQIIDANRLEYVTEYLRLQQLHHCLLGKESNSCLSRRWVTNALHWLGLSLILLLSADGTSFGLIFGVGMVAIAYFGLLFWLLDRWRRRYPQPIMPTYLETVYMLGSFAFISCIGIITIFSTSEQPGLTLLCLGIILLPMPLLLLWQLYQQGRYHNLIDVTYFVEDGGVRQLQLLIARLPIIPRFPFFRDRYLPILWERHWNWLNYYDFSLNNFLKFGFNDIRLRDQHLPGIITTLVWYQWSLGILYIALLLWTLSRTIPGLNLLIYLK